MEGGIPARHELSNTVAIFEKQFRYFPSVSFQVEPFKKDQRWQNSLHAKFHVSTGDEVVTDNDYNHFQVS